MKRADSSTFLVRNRTPGEKSQAESTEMVLLVVVILLLRLIRLNVPVLIRLAEMIFFF